MARRDVSILALVWLLTHVSLLTWAVIQAPEYFRNCDLNANPDAVHYCQLGVRYITHGLYSRQAEPPFLPDVLRTPAYPLIAGALITASGAVWPLYVLQSLLALASAACVGAIARLLGAERGYLLLAVIYLVDSALIIQTMQALTETLYTLLVLIATIVTVRGVTRVPDVIRGAAIGALLGIAILTRPAGVYLPIIFAAFLLVPLISSAFRWRTIATAAVMALTALSLVAPWIVRNCRQFDYCRLTTADTINLLYFAAAGVYQVQYDLTREEAEARIVREYNVATLTESNNPWLRDYDISEMDDRQRRAAKEILTSNPKALIVSTATGIGKALVSHNVVDLAHIVGRQWSSPGLSRLRSGDFGEFRRGLFANGPLLTVLFWQQIGFALFAILAGIVGACIVCLSPSTRLAGLAVLTLLMYGLLTTAVVGIDAYWRHRAAVTPFLMAFAAVAVYRGSSWWCPSKGCSQAATAAARS